VKFITARLVLAGAPRFPLKLRLGPAGSFNGCPQTLIAMRRIQFIELHEQPWFPSTLRGEVTDALQFGSEVLKIYAPISALLQGALEASGSRSIVDLCSGSGGPWLELSKVIGGHSAAYGILLTDKFPVRAASGNPQAASANGIRFYEKSVDATKVPAELNGFRTMFTSFHHFPPAQARAILQDAADAGVGIGIFEVTRRAASAVATMFVWWLSPLVLTPFMRPFRWSHLLFTYVLPIIPLVLLFDGVVSCLRSYRPEELRAMVEELEGSKYHWEIGEQAGNKGSPPITYLIGYPNERRPV
jgi:hypothetical protein